MKTSTYQLTQNLIEAVCAGNIEAAEKCINEGASVNAKVLFGKRPIMFAVEKGRNEMILFLKKHGARINVYDEDGEHLLFYTLAEKQQNKMFDMIKTLLLLKSDRDITSELNTSFFSKIALRLTPKQMQEISLLGLPMHLAGTNQEETVLHLLAKSEHVKDSNDSSATEYLVSQAVKDGVRLDAISSYGITAWETACINKNPLMMRAIKKVATATNCKNFGSSLVADLVDEDPTDLSYILEQASIKEIKIATAILEKRLKSPNARFFEKDFEQSKPAIESSLLKKSLQKITQSQPTKRSKI
jgi:ankyrin repeat protein